MRGGKREGAGRKRGSRNRRSVQAYIAAEAGGELPLDHMLSIMRSKSKGIDDERRDRMAIAAAPYLHAKLTAVSVEKVPNIDLSKLSDDELQRAIELRRELEELFAEANRRTSAPVTSDAGSTRKH
jgi:hypothetical protein